VVSKSTFSSITYFVDHARCLCKAPSVRKYLHSRILPGECTRLYVNRTRAWDMMACASMANVQNPALRGFAIETGSRHACCHLCLWGAHLVCHLLHLNQGHKHDDHDQKSRWVSKWWGYPARKVRRGGEMQAYPVLKGARARVPRECWMTCSWQHGLRW